MHERERKISSVSSSISKLDKDADECYDNAEKPDACTATPLSTGNAFRKPLKEKKIVLNNLEKEVENLKKQKRKLICKQLKIDDLGYITRFYPKKSRSDK